MRRDPDVIKTFRKIKEQMFLSGLKATIKSFISAEKYDVERLEFRKGVFGMIGYIYFYVVPQAEFLNFHIQRNEALLYLFSQARRRTSFIKKI